MSIAQFNLPINNSCIAVCKGEFRLLTDHCYAMVSD